MPSETIKKIIISNSPVSAPVLSAVNALNLRDGAADQIAEAQTDGISERQELFNQIGYHDWLSQIAVNEEIRLFINDTISTNPIDSVINILNLESSVERQSELASAYLAKKDLVNAQLVLNSLNSMGTVSEFCKLLAIEIQLATMNQTASALNINSVLFNKVMAIASDTSQFGSSNAKAMIQFANGTTFQERIDPLAFNSSHTMIKSKPDPDVEKSDDRAIVLYPNPTNDRVNISYTLPEGVSSAVISTFDMMGRRVFSYQLSNQKGILNQNVSELPSGIYFYMIIANGAVVAHDKLVISK